MLIFLLCLLITIIVHELGHLFTALACGIGVKTFSIGFGKPLFHKKIKGIDFRISPLLLGGYCKLEGEDSKEIKNGFLAQKYSKKFLVLVAGVTMNLLLACLCYLIMYQSISVGIKLDFTIIRLVFAKEHFNIAQIILGAKANLFLMQLSLLNVFCGLTNLFPIPALDGGHLWMVWMEKVWKKNFIKIYKRISVISFILLMMLQFVFLYWIIFV